MSFDNIRSIGAFVRYRSDWKVFDNKLGSSNKRPSDLDGYCTRKGNTLFLEEKSKGKQVDTGQQITFKEWHLAPDKVTMVLWYEQDDCYDANGLPILDKHGLHDFTRDYCRMEIYVPGVHPITLSINGADKIIKFYQNWYEYADTHPYLTKQQMIERITNGIGEDDIAKLFNDVTKAYTLIED